MVAVSVALLPVRLWPIADHLFAHFVGLFLSWAHAAKAAARSNRINFYGRENADAT